jgi:TatD DNase family protein
MEPRPPSLPSVASLDPSLRSFPSLDAHAHLDVRHHPQTFDECGFVLAQTMSLAEAEGALARTDDAVAFGDGVHPRLGHAQAAFDVEHFGALMARTPMAGEVGLDAGSRSAWETQLATFRAVLAAVARSPRLLSIHSYRAPEAVLDELRRTPVIAPILHWWTGSAALTSRAVELGCYFSVHAAVARQSKWRTRVPLERILVESDHGWSDPPAAIPLRVGWVEHLLADQYRVAPEEIRAAAWRNLATIVDATGTRALLPPGLAGALPSG